MPSSIPYDPSLVLASVVSRDALHIVTSISEAQAPTDAVKESLNALLSSRRSLDMTKTEIANLGIDTKELDAAISEVNANISKAASGYAASKAKSEGEIQGLRAKIQGVHSQVESPVDFVKSQIKSLPLASDSISMDVQYFSRDSNKQDSKSFATAISSFVSASTSEILTPKVSLEMSTAAQQQVSQQVEQHKIEGTLVFSVSCTHKNAMVLAPFILQVDKAIKVWNSMFKDDKLKPTDRNQMIKLAMSNSDSSEENKFSIISGMTFGSSFVGMVHVLNVSDTNAGESLSNYTSQLQAQMDAGAWFMKAAGGFGVNESIGNDVKNLLSTQNVTSHVTMVSMGVIPSIAANDLKMGVKQFSEFDPKASMDAIATIQSATNTNHESVQSAASAARTGKQMVSMKANEIQAGLQALADIEKVSNKVLDVNSMMKALDDYVQKASTGSCGIPINYYLKDITKEMLAEMWVAKYYPGEFMAIKYDDSEGAGPASGASGGT